MAKSIKYRFDEVMLRFVKELNLKTTAFGGYDKDDVYEKIKRLISDARTVCEEVYEEAVNEIHSEKDAADIQLDQAQINGLVQGIDSLEAQVKELEETEANLKQKITDLEEKLSVYSNNTQKLERASEILREARLEADRIVIAGKEEGEQEVLLGRAKSRAESEKAAQELNVLYDKSEKLREYLKGGEVIQKQMQEYADSFVFEGEVVDLNGKE